MHIRVKTADCGIRIIAAAHADTRQAVAAVCAEIDPDSVQHIIAFYSIQHDAQILLEDFTAAFPTLPVAGCSTAGELGPLGMLQGGLVVLAFPKRGFRILSDVIPDIADAGVERASDIARQLKLKILNGKDEPAGDRVFALILIDGLCNTEEALIAAVHWVMGDIGLLGGSAGDGLVFDHTTMIHGGRIVRGGALLFLIESDTPFTIFKTQNFEPTPTKLVVTAADTENRTVYELNAEPAAREYAAAIGLTPDDLGPFSFASYPLVVKVGGDYYCRSIRNMNENGSLSFFCAIDEGLVFTVARPRDIVATTRETLERVDAELRGTDFVLGFDCILRRLDAESRQVRHELEGIYQRYGIAGFHTYGEQFNAMHLNQTLTGIAFAKSAGLKVDHG